MPTRPFEQEKQFRTDEQSGASVDADVKKSYKQYDSNNPPVVYTTGTVKKGYESPQLQDAPPARRAFNQKKQFRTDEQAGVRIDAQLDSYGNPTY